MGHKNISNEPYYPEVIRDAHKCSGCEQLQAELATAKDENRRLWDAVDEIEAVACGETQIEADGDYDDGDGMKWIYDRTQALKEKP